MTTRTPATEKPVQLDVSILGRDYKVACRESERAELMQAVALLDGRMREIRDTGKVAAVDRIAVMAAQPRERAAASTRRTEGAERSRAD